jgi:gamma-glutamyl hercynylcysteine S-oxide synthase
MNSYSGMRILEQFNTAGQAAQLRASRARSRALTQDLRGEQLSGPLLPVVNPVLWELGHIAWFQEHWCLRWRGDGSLATSVLPGADALYDSAAIAHDLRWDLPLPVLGATLAYQDRVLDLVEERMWREPGNPSLAYFVQLAAFHEDMHAEAFHYTRQTLAYAAPQLPLRDAGRAAGAPAGSGGDASIPGGRYQLGAGRDVGFVFDNEKWEHPVEVRPFKLARCTVSNAEYTEFVEEDGYLRRELWSEAGWSWLQQSAARAPQYWRKQDGRWQQRRFDVWAPLSSREPVMHVNWHEAQAYCRYAGRRLPSEAEWEIAAACAGTPAKRRYPWGDTPPDAWRANLEANAPIAVGALPAGASAHGCLQLIGNVWEWTDTDFGPYPGFEPDPYKEYSQPWFGTHKVLRGGSFATPARLIRNTWRNFYTPERYDIFAGFRTCAIRN